MLGIIASYAIAISLFMLCVPIAAKELVSYFAVEPRMIFTLALMVADAFRVLRARAVETLQQRIYTRIATAFTQTFPRLQEESLLPQHANRFSEADLLTRARGHGGGSLQRCRDRSFSCPTNRALRPTSIGESSLNNRLRARSEWNRSGPWRPYGSGWRFLPR